MQNIVYDFVGIFSIFYSESIIQMSKYEMDVIMQYLVALELKMYCSQMDNHEHPTAEPRIIPENLFSTMGADALASCITMSSASVVPTL